MKQTIGEFLSTLRKANGYTQAEVAEKLNVSNRTLSSWETDRTAPDLTILPAIADLYGVTADEILRGERSSALGSGLITEQAKRTLRKGRYAKFNGKYMLVNGIALFCALLFIAACALHLYTASPVWLNVLLMVLGLGGAAAGVILTLYFQYSALTAEGLVLKEDFTDDDCAYALCIKRKVALVFYVFAAVFAVAAVAYLIAYLLVKDQRFFTVGNIVIYLTYENHIALICVNAALAVGFLVAAVCFYASTFKNYASAAQTETARRNRQQARKIYGIPAIAVGVLLAVCAVLSAIPFNIVKTEFSCKSYDELVEHLHTLVIDKRNDLNGAVPHGSYLLSFPTADVIEDVEYDLGNGFTGRLTEVGYWIGDNLTTSMQWSVSYCNQTVDYYPVFEVDYGSRLHTFAALPYVSWADEYFVPLVDTGFHFSLEYDGGFNVRLINNLSWVNYIATALIPIAAVTYATACTAVYLCKRKKQIFAF